MPSSSPDVSEILPARIRERLDATGKSMRGVSLAIGAHAGYVRDLLDPERFNVPAATRLQALAAELETTTEYLLGEASGHQQVASEVALGDKRIAWHGPEPSDPPIPIVGTGDCADLSVCDESGQMVEVERSSFDPDYHVRYIQRPPALRGARDLYAIYFQGSSMEPRYDPGDIGLVDPNRHVGPGDYVVVQLLEEGGRAVDGVLVKRLVRMTARELVLEQFNPPMVFTLPRSRVARVHRIIRQTDLLF